MRKWLVLFFLTTHLFAANSFLKERMLHDLDHIHELFTIKYAPKEWKEQYKQWSLEKEMKKAKSQLNALTSPTTEQFQKIVYNFCQSTADYHVRVTFYATGEAMLPFSIKGVEDRYYIVDIDRYFLPYDEFPFEEGDELLSFNGVSTKKAVAEFKKEYYFGNVAESDQARAEQAFTFRRACKGHLVPSGDVKLEIRRKGDFFATKETLSWYTFPEKVAPLGSYSLATKESSKSKKVAKKGQAENFLTRKMCAYDLLSDARKDSEKFSICGYTTFVPELGNITWSYEGTLFYAYIFESPEGNRVGYVRLPDFLGEECDAREFERIIRHMQAHTDGLIIDQMNNPGGSHMFLYELVSMLISQPITPPKHHISITYDDVQQAVDLIEIFEEIDTIDELQEIIEESFDGYPATLELMDQLKQFSEDLLQEWGAGRQVSHPLYLTGIDRIKPHARVRYTKPLLILINELDFSAADFFPALLSERALLVGKRTGGAGGFVISHPFPNLSSIESIDFTGSLAIRNSGEPIENLGVQPHIELALTPSDMQNNYQDFKESLLSITDSYLKK